jgi:hypothetical protein
MKSNVLALVCIACLSLAFPVFADDGTQSLGHRYNQQENGQNSSLSQGRRQGPPTEAYTACESKNIGDSAQFVSPSGETITGTCEQEGDRIVLRPNDRPKGNDRARHQGPPPEAYTACDDKNAGDSAQFTSPRGETVEGTCEEENGKLVLRPDQSQRDGARRKG